MSRLPTVALEHFEGPFDLLVELARSHKLDLSEVSLRTITDDFLEYMEQYDIPPETQGDFLVVAATLLLIKVRQLLPELTEEEEEEVQELTDRVRIYQLYRERAQYLQQHWHPYQLAPAHFWASVDFRPFVFEQVLPAITPDTLTEAFLAVLRSLPKPAHPRAHMVRRGRSLEECLSIFTTRLARAKELVFQETMKGSSRQDTAISFLAVLEMARSKHIELHQLEPFQNIIIRRTSAP